MDHSSMISTATLILILALATKVHSQGAWLTGHATFYGNKDPRESEKGACGYDNVFTQGYGTMTAALSTALFNKGYTCGACFEIKCVNDPQWCLPGTVIVTATNFCPPSNKPSNNGGWCNPPLQHFDLNFPAFIKIAKEPAGIIPIQYRRVPCTKTGGINFEMKGTKDWITVLVFNVGGAGDVKAASIKGSNTGWIPMTKNWGQIWQVTEHPELVGQGLSFQVTTSDGRMVESIGVAPPTWQFGRTYQGKQF